MHEASKTAIFLRHHFQNFFSTGILLSMSLVFLSGSAGSAQTTAERIGVGPIVSVPSSGQVQAMKLLAPGVGWALAGSQLLFTSTAGTTWDDITPQWRATGVIDGVYFLSSGTGWAFLHDSSQATPYRDLETAVTLDFGRTWTYYPFTSASSDDLINYSGTAWLQFLDSQHGWMVLRGRSSSAFSRGLLFSTEDGGKSWVNLPSPPLGEPVQFISLAVAWMVGGPNGHEIYVTRDAGTNWEPVQIPEPEELGIGRVISYELSSITSDGRGQVIARYRGVGNDILVTHSTSDGGRTWSTGNVDGTIREDAVFIGHPSGLSQVRLLGADSHVSMISIDAGQFAALTTPLPGVVSIADFNTPQTGWIATASNDCDDLDGVCWNEQHILRTSDGGLSYVDITPPQLSPNQLPATLPETGPMSLGVTPLVTVTSKNVMAFDECSYRPLTTMQSWFTTTPYRAVGVYLGGVHNCGELPDASWISTVSGYGWKLLPLWVGRQVGGPPNNFTTNLIGGTGDPESEGKSEADQAWNRACSQLGLSCPTIIYYDLEGAYLPTYGATASLFIKGWVEELHADGQLAGVYSNNPDFQDLTSTALGGVVPDAIWPVYYPADGAQCGTSCENVFGIPYVSDSSWVNDQRIRQTGQKIETSLCFSGYSSCVANPDPTNGIDEDWADGPSATVGASTVLPQITSFDIQPRSATVGTTLTATIVGTSGSNPLSSVSLLRTIDLTGTSGWTTVATKSVSSSPVNITLTDSSAPVGTYLYGAHLTDNTSQFGTEPSQLQVTITATAGGTFQVGNRIMAQSTGANVRNSSLNTVLFTQDGGVHGTITGGPTYGTAGGYTGNWWNIAWDSEPPSQNNQSGWSAESVLSLAPTAGDIQQPSFSSNAYGSNSNIFWASGYAPSSTTPPNPQLGSALGNCTWYAFGRMLDLGANQATLSSLHGNADQWATEASANGIPVDTNPTVHSIAELDSNSGFSNGHVAVVESVNSDGTITVTESSYDTNTTSTWDFLWRHRTVSPGWFSHFIHVPLSGGTTPTITAFTASTNTVTAGASVGFTITLSAAASTTTTVNLTSSANSVVPGGSIIIPAGTSSGQTTLTSSSSVTQLSQAVITASLGGVSFGQTQTITVNPTTTTTLTEPVGTTSETQAGTVLLSSSFTLGSIKVVTQGATGLDFTDVSGGTCAVGTAYSAGQTCTVNYTFTPTAPGQRLGAIVIADQSANVVATQFISGAGVGPQAVMYPGTQSLAVNSGLSYPRGIAMDGSGNIYIADSGNNRVVKEVLSGGTYLESTVWSGLNEPIGVAVDGAGSVYIADTFNSRVLKETLSGGGYVQSTVGSGLDLPYGLAVDGSGNVFIADTLNKRVLKEALSGSSYTQTVAFGSGLSSPDSVAIDGSGNIYIVDSVNDVVLKETLSSGSYTESTVTTGLTTPQDVVVDGGGSLYITNDGPIKTLLKETPSGSSYIESVLIANRPSPGGLALDSSGNLYFAETYDFSVQKIDVSDPQSLSFASTAVGSTSSDSPQTVTLWNIGNATLTFPVPSSGNNPNISTNFALNSSGSTACPQISDTASSGGTLAVGASCTLAIGFAPTAAGTISGSLVVSDNSLNEAYGQQTISLGGTATSTQVAQSITFTPPSSPVTFGVSPITLSASASSGLSVTFSVISGPGTVSGNTLTVTGVGIIVLAANQAGNTNYSAATQVTQIITVNQATQTISFTAPASPVTYGISPITLSASSTSGLAITFNVVSGPGTINSSTLTITGVGTVVVAANQTGNTNYAAATQVTQSVVVNPAPPTITFTVPNHTYGDAPFTVSATSNSTGAMTYSVVSGPATISGATVTLTGAGTVVLQASQAATGNYTLGTQTATFTVAVTQAQTTPTVTVTPSASSITTAQALTVTVAVSGGTGNPTATGSVTLSGGGYTSTPTSLSSGSATISIPAGSLATGSDTLTASYTPDSNSSSTYNSANGTGSVTVSATGTGLTEPVGTSSSTQTATILLSESFTLQSISVVTQGASNLDFNIASGGTCTTGTNYSTGQTCTVNFTFAPKAPGQRMGAILLLDGGGLVQATEYISGVGTGPQISFFPGSQGTIGSGFNSPTGVAMDASGDVFIADSGDGGIAELTAASGYITNNFHSGFNKPTGVAVDGAGNVFVADPGNNAVKEILVASGSEPFRSLSGSFNAPWAVAVDASGNVFVADSGNNAVKEIPLGCVTSSCVSTLGSGFNSPQGIALDGAGNIFVGDSGNHAVKEITKASGYSQVEQLVNVFDTPMGVAVDASGNVFVADSSANAVEEILVVSSYTKANMLGSGFDTPTGVTVDPSGNVVVADSLNNRVVKLDLSDAPSLGFASTAVGLTSSDSPQTVTLENNGNTALTFPIPSSGSNPSISTNFTLNSSGGTACPLIGSTAPSIGTLAVGASCTLSISFAPTEAGSISGTLALTDNNLNGTNVTQTISLSGTATTATIGTTTTLSSSLNPSSFGQSVTLTATVATPSGSTTPTGTVLFSVDGSPAGAVATLNGGTATYMTSTLAVGTRSITAVYSPTMGSAFITSNATALSQVVNRATPTVTVTPSLSSITTAQTLTVTIAVSGASGNPTPTGSVTLSSGAYTSATATLSSGSASISVPAGKLVTGNDTLTATYTPDSASSSTYNSANGTTAPVTVTQATQTIIFPTIPTQTVGTPLTLLATASSGLAVSFTSATIAVCTVSGASATFIASGTCTIDANQAGNTIYAAATMVPQSFIVDSETQTITFANPGTQTVGTPLTLVATSTSNLAVSFTSATTTICTVTDITTTFIASGTCIINANQAGNSKYAAAPQVQQSFTVNAAPGFALSASPTTVSVAQGSNETTTVTMTDVGGFSGAVSLSASGVPSGVSASFVAGSVAGTQVLTLAASTSATVTPTPVTVTITGTSGALSATTSIALTITAEPSFTPGTGGTTSITLAPGATTGNTGTISVAGTNGFTGTVALSCAVSTSIANVNDMPKCSLNPNSVSLNGTVAQNSTLTVTTTASSSAQNLMKKLFWPSTGGSALALVLFLVTPKRRRNWYAFLGLVLLFVVTGAVGCGGGGSGSGGSGGGGGGGTPDSGTSAGTYTVTVTGTGTSSGSSSSVTATVGTVTLTVN